MATWTNERLLNLILVFVITGVWDIILRYMSEGKIKFLGVERMKWVVVLREYFRKHTLLAAALIAAFVGAVTYAVIVYLVDHLNVRTREGGLLLTLLVSGLIGIPMRYSGLFPVLYEHYYKPLGFWYSLGTDTFSGLVVALTLEALKRLSA